MNLFTLDTWYGPAHARLYSSHATDLSGLEYVVNVLEREVKDGQKIRVAFNREGVSFNGCKFNRSIWMSLAFGYEMSFRPCTLELLDEVREMIKIKLEDSVRRF